MKQPWPVLTGAMIAIAAGSAWADAKFSHLAARVEQNATDNDFEVVFEATSGETGLAALQVTAPDGRIVIDFKAPNSKLGMRTFRLETPEPKSQAKLQSDFPVGRYTFTASTTEGTAVSGSAMLTHKLPAPANLVRPRVDEEDVPLNGLRVQWTSLRNLASCLVTIENEAGVKLIQAVLPGSATTFAVPDRLLLPGTKYHVSVGTVTPQGNASFVETSFRTARKSTS